MASRLLLAPLGSGSGPPLPLTDLEIKVSNFLCVQVVHPVQDLLNEAGGLLLTQRLLLGQEIKELSSRHSARHQWGRTRPSQLCTAGGQAAMGVRVESTLLQAHGRAASPLTASWGCIQTAAVVEWASWCSAISLP